MPLKKIAMTLSRFYVGLNDDLRKKVVFKVFPLLSKLVP